MILALDIGNTNIKLALFQGIELKELYVLNSENFENFFLEILTTNTNCNEIVISSVGKLNLDLKKILFKHSLEIKVNEINSESVFPFINLYETPLTLGIDRAVLAAGAVLKFPNTNSLIIDAGTCVTFDYIDEKNCYLGGAISPGLMLRYKSLNDYTAKLPLLTPNYPKDSIGNSTFESIHSGVVNGLLSEIQYITDNFMKHYEKFNIILTGGDALFLAKRIKNPIFANSNFLLESLILLHQYQQKK